MLSPSSEAAEGLAWYSILGSCRLFLQIAHVSVQIDQDQTATAFHFLTSKHEAYDIAIEDLTIGGQTEVSNAM